MKKLDSKELRNLLITLIIGIPTLILAVNIKSPSLLFGWIILIITVIIAVILFYAIIFKRIGELDKALDEQETKQIDLEKKLIRCEQLIDIKADIKDLQRRMEILEYGKKSWP